MTKRPMTRGLRKPAPTKLASRSGVSSGCWTRRWRNRTRDEGDGGLRQLASFVKRAARAALYFAAGRPGDAAGSHQKRVMNIDAMRLRYRRGQRTQRRSRVEIGRVAARKFLHDHDRFPIPDLHGKGCVGGSEAGMALRRRHLEILRMDVRALPDDQVLEAAFQIEF